MPQETLATGLSGGPAAPLAMPPGSSPAGAARERAIGLACAFAVVIVWSGFSLSARLGGRQALTGWDMGALRYAGSFVMGLLLVAGFGWPRLSLARSAGLVAGAAFVFPLAAYFGFRYAPTAHGGVLLTGLLPFAAALLGWLWLGERWTRMRVISLAVVAGGILLLTLDTFGSHPGAWRGDLLFILGCLGWAVFTVLVRRWQVPALTATTVLALYPPILYLPVWYFFLPSSLGEASSGAVIYQLIYQGMVAVVVAGFLFTRAVNALGSATTTTITALTPALAALVAWPLLGETLGPLGLAGVAIVSAGMALGVAGARR
ncbi:DMT family transporter [Roseomonas sp. 18066]|uniref:DMT family transporter n=1 Tax=Roseomonas sp. 18066 TaxID=2681412 RepID=UPI001F447278|nr:DMT family transporter [Roseomonas sp. 18066]